MSSDEVDKRIRELANRWWAHRPLWAYPDVDEVDDYLEKWANEEGKR